MTKENLLKLSVYDFTSILLDFFYIEFEMRAITPEGNIFKDTLLLEGSRDEIYEIVDCHAIFKNLGFKFKTVDDFCDVYVPSLDDVEIRTYIKEKSCDYDKSCLHALEQEIYRAKSDLDEYIDSYLLKKYSEKGYELPEMGMTEKRLRQGKLFRTTDPVIDFDAMRKKLRPFDEYRYVETMLFIKEKIDDGKMADNVIHYNFCLDIPVGVLFYIWNPLRPAFNILIATQREYICKELWNKVFEKHPEIAPLHGFEILICMPGDYCSDDYQNNALASFCNSKQKLQRAFAINEQMKGVKNPDDSLFVPAFYFRCAHPQQLKLGQPGYKEEVGYTIRLCVEGDYCDADNSLPETEKLINDLSNAINYHISKYSQPSSEELLGFVRYGENYITKALSEMWQKETLLRKNERFTKNHLLNGEFLLMNIDRKVENVIPLKGYALCIMSYYVLESGSEYKERHVCEIYDREDPILYMKANPNNELKSEYTLNLKALWETLTEKDSYEICGNQITGILDEDFYHDHQEQYQLFEKLSNESLIVFNKYCLDIGSSFDKNGYIITHIGNPLSYSSTEYYHAPINAAKTETLESKTRGKPGRHRTTFIPDGVSEELVSRVIIEVIKGCEFQAGSYYVNQRQYSPPRFFSCLAHALITWNLCNPDINVTSYRNFLGAVCHIENLPGYELLNTDIVQIKNTRKLAKDLSLDFFRSNKNLPTNTITEKNFPKWFDDYNNLQEFGYPIKDIIFRNNEN